MCSEKEFQVTIWQISDEKRKSNQRKLQTKLARSSDVSLGLKFRQKDSRAIIEKFRDSFEEILFVL